MAGKRAQRDAESSDEEEVGEAGALLAGTVLPRKGVSVAAAADAGVEECEGRMRWAAAELPAQPAEAKGKNESRVPTRLDSGFDDVGSAEAIQAMERGELTAKESGKFMSSIARDQATTRAKRSGELRGFHDMVAPDMTPEMERDLKVLQLRNYMDPKRFYKASDRKGLPTTFQIGTVKEGLGEFKSHRMRASERKPTILQQVLGDKAVTAYTTRVYGEVQRERKNTMSFKEMRKSKKRKVGGGGAKGAAKGRKAGSSGKRQRV